MEDETVRAVSAVFHDVVGCRVNRGEKRIKLPRMTTGRDWYWAKSVFKGVSVAFGNDINELDIRSPKQGLSELLQNAIDAAMRCV